MSLLSSSLSSISNPILPLPAPRRLSSAELLGLNNFPCWRVGYGSHKREAFSARIVDLLRALTDGDIATIRSLVDQWEGKQFSAAYKVENYESAMANKESHLRKMKNKQDKKEVTIKDSMKKGKEEGKAQILDLLNSNDTLLEPQAFPQAPPHPSLNSPSTASAALLIGLATPFSIPRSPLRSTSLTPKSSTSAINPPLPPPSLKPSTSTINPPLPPSPLKLKLSMAPPLPSLSPLSALRAVPPTHPAPCAASPQAPILTATPSLSNISDDEPPPLKPLSMVAKSRGKKEEKEMTRNGLDEIEEKNARKHTLKTTKYEAHSEENKVSAKQGTKRPLELNDSEKRDSKKPKLSHHDVQPKMERGEEEKEKEKSEEQTEVEPCDDMSRLLLKLQSLNSNERFAEAVAELMMWYGIEVDVVDLNELPPEVLMRLEQLVAKF